MEILLIILLILLLFLMIEKYLIQKELFTNDNIIFYKKKNLFDILKKDKDKYFQSFFETDLKVRKVSNKNQYLKVLENSLCDPDEKTINKIKNYIVLIKSKINKYINNNGNYYNDINLKKFNSIQWKIGFVCDSKYENGLPHTRNDIIILNKNKINLNHDLKNIKTIIHEKIHVYQKLFSEDVKIYLTNKKYTKLKKITKFDNIRANPDLDNYIYRDNDFNIYKAIYNKNASSIEDITYYPYNSQLYEHPYEKMAIEFENIIDN